MSEIWNIRIQNKCDTKEGWNATGAVTPLYGELIVVKPNTPPDPNNLLPTIKIGNGTESATALEGIASQAVVLNPATNNEKQYKIRTTDTASDPGQSGYITFVTY